MRRLTHGVDLAVREIVRPALQLRPERNNQGPRGQLLLNQRGGESDTRTSALSFDDLNSGGKAVETIPQYREEHLALRGQYDAM